MGIALKWYLTWIVLVICITYGYSEAAKIKRDITRKLLEDPGNCTRQCQIRILQNATSSAAATKEKFKAENSSSNASITAKQPVKTEKKLAFDLLGEYYQKLCNASKEAEACYKSCPPSQERHILLLNNATAEVFCEPSDYFGNFTDYYEAAHCLNKTIHEAPCKSKCGTKDSLTNVTSVNFQPLQTSGFILQYESDLKKNKDAVEVICRTLSCEMDCYKPILSQKCGPKAYHLYSRTTTVEPRNLLNVLKALNAVDQEYQCKSFD